MICGTPFHNVTFEETIAWCLSRIREKKPSIVITANLDHLLKAQQDPEYQHILREADLVVADGYPVLWLSRLLGPALKDRVTGSDLVPLLAKTASENDLSVYALGGKPGVAEKALSRLQEECGRFTVAGISSPEPGALEAEGLLKELRENTADIMFVALGNPKQEKFIHRHLGSWTTPVSIGVGASLDFIAGAQTRAPRWIQRLRMEWLWRMSTDPKRLAVLRLDNTLLGRLAGSGAGVSGTEKAASANAGDVRELLSINLIQRYNFLREADADPLQGPGFSGDQETDAGEPLLPLILSGQAKGAGYTLRFRLDYHHQQDRLTRAALSWAGQAGPHTSLSAGYGFNAFTHFTPDNKLVPESNSFNFAGEMALGGALSMGFSGRFNLLDRAPPLDKRLDRSLLFLEYNPACYAVRLSVEETVNTVLENGQESFFVNRRVALTFNLRGLVGGGKTATRNENNTPPARQTAALGPPARCGI
ncbi:MAG: WecB/TagA/CpsF family glycosyltransferase [SAR324 cluster bacterium]|nr:WecB/TagA/CpsF family glycosyltransferase [SAR324 cluster bacterium]